MLLPQQRLCRPRCTSLGDGPRALARLKTHVTKCKVNLLTEPLVFSNTDLTGSRVRNYKRMQERRVLFKVGITYNTPSAVMNEVPDLLKTIVKSVERTRFDRAHFASFGPSSLDLEIVYYVLSPDYNVYMDIQQNINFAIKKGFESRGIDFAFPTQTIYMAGGQTPPVPVKG
jgi:small-conductance mechanosensitive channel